MKSLLPTFNFSLESCLESNSLLNNSIIEESWCNPGPTLHAFSPSFIERPSASDWPEDIVTTGYWFLPSSESTQYIENREMIEDFLDQHAEKPLYIGFGSMTHQYAS